MQEESAGNELQCRPFDQIDRHTISRLRYKRGKRDIVERAVRLQKPMGTSQESLGNGAKELTIEFSPGCRVQALAHEILGCLPEFWFRRQAKHTHVVRSFSSTGKYRNKTWRYPKPY